MRIDLVQTPVVPPSWTPGPTASHTPDVTATPEVFPTAATPPPVLSTTPRPPSVCRATVTSTTGLYVRAGPGLSGQVLGALRYLAEVRLLAQAGEWYRIDYLGAEGYIAGAFLRMLDESACAALPSEG
jgi:uncharacterized protein YgiM (DUF1202 family)